LLAPANGNFIKGFGERTGCGFFLKKMARCEIPFSRASFAHIALRVHAAHSGIWPPRSERRHTFIGFFVIVIRPVVALERDQPFGYAVAVTQSSSL
jgi:hypothetical protein